MTGTWFSCYESLYRYCAYIYSVQYQIEVNLYIHTYIHPIKKCQQKSNSSMYRQTCHSITNMSLKMASIPKKNILLTFFKDWQLGDWVARPTLTTTTVSEGFNLGCYELVWRCWIREGQGQDPEIDSDVAFSCVYYRFMLYHYISYIYIYISYIYIYTYIYIYCRSQRASVNFSVWKVVQDLFVWLHLDFALWSTNNHH